MVTTPAPVPEAQAATISPLGRVFGVLFLPKKTFEDIVRKPSWLLPFAIFLALVVAVCVCLNLWMNWRGYVRQLRGLRAFFNLLTDVFAPVHPQVDANADRHDQINKDRERHQTAGHSDDNGPQLI